MNTCCDNASQALVGVEKGLAKTYGYVHPDHKLISQVKQNLKITERKLNITSVEKERLKTVFTAARQILREKDAEIEHFKQILMQENEEDEDIFAKPNDMTPTQLQTFDEVVEKLRNFLAKAMDACAQASGMDGPIDANVVRDGLLNVNTY